MARPKKSNHIEQKARQVVYEVESKTFLAIASAFAFVMALTWNEAIKEGVNQIIVNMGLTGEAYIYKIITAIIVTVICIMGIMLFSKIRKKDQK